MKSIDIHQVNVVGLGAEKFASGLVRHLLSVSDINIQNVYINSSAGGEVYEADTNINFVSYLFGWFSRIFEVLFWRIYRTQKNELLVLGDLPLNTSAKQYVLCHQSLMFKKFPVLSLKFLKFALFRSLFKFFLKQNDVVLVQTNEMARNVRNLLNKEVDVQVIDLKSSFFGWPQFFRTGRRDLGQGQQTFELIYPAALYGHKNHHLLNGIEIREPYKVILTIDEKEFEKTANEIYCIGKVSRDKIYELYERVDALLFLSSNESLGMPVLEAIKCNIPIICPYAEYTKELGSENCFFFNIEDPSSLVRAMELAKSRILEGWWSDWNFDSIASNVNSVAIEDIILKTPVLSVGDI